VMNKLKKMNRFQVSHSMRGLGVLVGSPFRIKQIQDGKEGYKCPFCSSVMTPLVSTKANLTCRECEALIYQATS
jgi:hypothetical protein